MAPQDAPHAFFIDGKTGVSVRARVAAFQKNGRELGWVQVDLNGTPAAVRKAHGRVMPWIDPTSTHMTLSYPPALQGWSGPRVAWEGDLDPTEFGAALAKEYSAQPDGHDTLIGAKRRMPVVRTAEFFSGSAHLTTSLLKLGRVESVTVDPYVFNALKNNTHLATRLEDLSVKELASLLCNRHYLHFSPVCTTFSNLATSIHQRNRGNNFLGVTQEAFEANAALVRIYQILKSVNKPLVFTIENPDAAFSYHPVIKAICVELGAVIVNLTFCAFGEKHRKPTSIITNSQTLIGLAEGDTLLDNPEFFDDPLDYVNVELARANKRSDCQPIIIESIFHCANAGGLCCFTGRPHIPITVRNAAPRKRGRDGKPAPLTNVGIETSEVTAFPPLLCDFIANCVQVDTLALRCDASGEPLTTFDRCDTTGCSFVDKHRGPCSFRFALTKKRSVCVPCA